MQKISKYFQSLDRTLYKKQLKTPKICSQNKLFQNNISEKLYFQSLPNVFSKLENCFLFYKTENCFEEQFPNKAIISPRMIFLLYGFSFQIGN